MISLKIGNSAMPNSSLIIILHLKEKSNNVQIVVSSFQKFTISEKLIQNVHNQFIIKEIVHQVILLQLYQLQVIDYVKLEQVNFKNNYHHNHQFLVIIKIIDVVVVVLQEYLKLVKNKVLLQPHVSHLLELKILKIIVMLYSQIVKNIKFKIIVLFQVKKILREKSLIMGQLLQLFKYSKISLYTKVEFMKLLKVVQNSNMVMQLKLLVGVNMKEQIIGLLKIHGEIHGELMV